VIGQRTYEDGFKAAVDLLVNRVELTCESVPSTHVVLCAVPQEIAEYCAEAGSYLLRHGRAHDRLFAKLLRVEQESGQLNLLSELFAGEATKTEFVYRNLRRAIKAKTMHRQKPLQIALESSLFSSSGQHPAIKAWNFCTANYYKATGALPWRLESLPADTCYVGIS
jgi:hypothetical protein